MRLENVIDLDVGVGRLEAADNLLKDIAALVILTVIDSEVGLPVLRDRGHGEERDSRLRVSAA